MLTTPACSIQNYYWCNSSISPGYFSLYGYKYSQLPHGIYIFLIGHQSPKQKKPFTIYAKLWKTAQLDEHHYSIKNKISQILLSEIIILMIIFQSYSIIIIKQSLKHNTLCINQWKMKLRCTKMCIWLSPLKKKDSERINEIFSDYFDRFQYIFS